MFNVDNGFVLSILSGRDIREMEKNLGEVVVEIEDREDQSVYAWADGNKHMYSILLHVKEDDFGSFVAYDLILNNGEPDEDLFMLEVRREVRGDNIVLDVFRVDQLNDAVSVYMNYVRNHDEGDL